MVDSGQSLEANDSHTTALGDVDGDGGLDMVRQTPVVKATGYT